MFNQPKPKTRLETEIDKLVLKLNDLDSITEDYGTTVERLSKLHKMQQEISPPPASVDWNTVLTVGAHILGIVLILQHEHLGVITSKALNFVPKPR